MLELLVAVAIVLIVEKRLTVERKLVRWEKWSEKMYPGSSDEYTRARLADIKEEYFAVLASTQKAPYSGLDETQYDIR